MMETKNGVIKELKNKSEWKEAFPIMKQLRTHLNEADFLELVKESSKMENYRLFALYDQSRVVAVTGFMPMITLYNGRFIWVCDLITDEKCRSNGYGKALLAFVHSWAIENGFKIVSLSSGLQRVDAHRFYETKMEYNKTSYVFLKRL